MERPDMALPTGMHFLSPHLTCANASEAIEFYKKAFDAVELARLPGPDGKLMHACVSINGSSVLLNDEFPDHGVVSPKALKGTPVTIHLLVRDADAVIARAEAAGATVVMPASDAFWGDRYGIVEDPSGHRWSIGTPQRAPLSPEELQAAAKAAMCAANQGEA